jgi:hypothetical protein
MIAKTLGRLFEINLFAIRANAEGVSDSEALLQPQPGGNCMNWIVGHIVTSREAMLTLLGEPPVLPAEVASRYKRGAPPVTAAGESGTLPLSELLAALTTSQERLLRGIKGAPEEKWSESVPNFGTAREAVHFLHFHEAYHAGQLALLRRMAGKKGAIQ